MILPSSQPRNFILDLRQTLMGSMNQRERDCQNWRALYYTGAATDQDGPAIANVIPSRINTQAGNLFSPDNLTFRLEYDFGIDDHVLQLTPHAGSYLSRELRDADADLEFGDAVHKALVEGCSFVQLGWEQNSGGNDGDGNLTADVIGQSCVGVLNERAKSLDAQEAFMVSFAVPVETLRVWLKRYKNTDDPSKAFDDRGGDARSPDANEVTRVVLGLNQPIGSGSGGQAGFINLMPRPPYLPSSAGVGRQMALDVIWLKDSTQDKWVAVFVIEGTDTIGTDIWRNPLALGPNGHEAPELAKHHNLIYVNPFPVKGSFFGRSAIADMAEPQSFIRRHAQGLDDILGKQEEPTHVGFGAVNTPDVYMQAFRTRNGYVQESGPNAKVQPFKPDMPENLIPALELASGWASDSANQPPVVQGRGESGVRAGAHADTLMTAASARERRPAVRVLRQCGDMGNLALEILRAKDGTQIPDGQNGEFLLETLPDGFHVLANGYSASPIFAAEHERRLVEMLKAGAIGPEEFLDGLNPAGHDILRNALRKREEQHAEIIKSLPPEDRVKLLSKSKR